MDAEVVAVGGGPVGLLLAGDLAARDVAVTVVDRHAEPSLTSRAFVVHARTLEILDARGLADDLVAAGLPVEQLRLPGGATADLGRLPTRFPFMLSVSQSVLDELLAARARDLGATVQRGQKVADVSTDGGPDGAVHTTVLDEVGTESKLCSRYVVGTDGAHSVVRQAAGLPFPGRSVVESVMLADVELATPVPRALMVEATEAGFVFLAPLGRDRHRIVAWDRSRPRSREDPVEFGEIRVVMRAILGTDYGAHNAQGVSRFHSDERQVPQYRCGQVFLAGDAAHVHSPVLGQGLNTGLQDAANLGWKLAASVRGEAAHGLLDTYHDERHPVGRAVLRSSGAVLRMTLLHSPVLRGLRNRATAAVTAPILGDRINHAISGLAVRYPAPRNADRMVGTRAPDLQVEAPPGRARLYEVLRDGRFVLITSHPPSSRQFGDINVVAPSVPQRASILVRPDGYIAWSGHINDPVAATGLAQLIHRTPLHSNPSH